jgi:NADPH-dependent 2,4-dienoyl-CoA reductase/sulfur reductase-like enzyme
MVPGGNGLGGASTVSFMGGRLVVIGGDAAGMSAAAAARRGSADLEIVALEKGSWTSYSACGIPYLVSGAVEDADDLVARSPQEHRDRSRIDVRTGHEAMAIDLDARRLEVRDHEHDRTYQLPFDLLHVATGALPFRPPLPGIDGPGVHGVQTLDDGRRLVEAASAASVSQVVVVGGGYIGLELAEAFKQRGVKVTVVERGNEVMPTLDPEMGSLVGGAMQDIGIDVMCGCHAAAFEDGAVVLDTGARLGADLVVLGLGVEPNAALARDAGIATGVKGGIDVDRRQRTSADGVYAAGDCCTSVHLVTGERVHIALGTVANKQGRVAGVNLGGGYATFQGVLGTAVSRVCSLEIGRTGLTEAEADGAGFVVDTAYIESTTRAGYFPGAKPIAVKLVADRASRRLLGAQIVGRGSGSAKRIDVMAVAITVGMTAAELVDADLGYAPPFGPLWDPVQVAARKLADG